MKPVLTALNESHRLRLRTKTLLKFSLKYAIVGRRIIAIVATRCLPTIKIVSTLISDNGTVMIAAGLKLGIISIFFFHYEARRIVTVIPDNLPKVCRDYSHSYERHKSPWFKDSRSCWSGNKGKVFAPPWKSSRIMFRTFLQVFWVPRIGCSLRCKHIARA